MNMQVCEYQMRFVMPALLGNAEQRATAHTIVVLPCQPSFGMSRVLSRS